jgi:parvulin-like peptidyl-prolyl isomerase
MTRNRSIVSGVSAAAFAIAFAGSIGQAVAQPAPAKTPPLQAAPPPSRATVAKPSPAPQAGEGREGANDIIARLGNIDVTADDVRAEIGRLGAREQEALAHDPALMSRTVRLLLANRLVLKEALAKKWDQQPAVAAQLERIREQAIIESYLQSVSALPDGFPTEAQIQAEYESNMSAMLVPRQFKVAQIFVAAAAAPDKQSEDKVRRKLDQVQKKVQQAGADFAAIAAADSEDRATAENGGELGWLSDTQLRPEIRSQVMGLANGAVSDPVRLDDGWHIIRLMDTKAAYTRPLSEVREQLAQRIREERAAANRRAYLAKLIEQSPPVINELALSRLLEKPGK